MFAANLSGTPRPVFVALATLALVLVGCRTSPPPDSKREPLIPTRAEPVKAEPDAKVVADKPSLAGQIEHVSMYPVPNHPENLAVSLVVSVRNAGALSIAQGWSLEVNSPSRRVPTVVEPVHVSGNVEMPGSNGTKADLAKEDLVLKTAQAPIVKGGRVKGILTFVLIKTSENELSNNNTSFTVHFKDSQSNLYQTPKSVIGRRAQPSDK
jgi:PBP1b-binding outer membrane lipoprotein LpoB